MVYLPNLGMQLRDIVTELWFCTGLLEIYCNRRVLIPVVFVFGLSLPPEAFTVSISLPFPGTASLQNLTAYIRAHWARSRSLLGVRCGEQGRVASVLGLLANVPTVV